MTRVNPEGIILHEISQTMKDKYGMISLNMWNIKNKQNRLTDIENKLMVARGQGDGGNCHKGEGA